MTDLWLHWHELTLLRLGTFMLSMLLQGVVLWCIAREYHWEYGTREWRQGWGMLAVAIGFLTLRRIAMLWHPAVLDAHWFESLDLWTPVITSALLALGFYRLGYVFHQVLPITEMPTAVVVTDADSVILEWGAQAEALFGWSAADAIGKTLMQTIIPPHQWEQHRAGIAAFVTAGESQGLKGRVLVTNARCKDGHDIPVEVGIVGVQVEGRWQFHGVIRRMVTL